MPEASGCAPRRSRRALSPEWGRHRTGARHAVWENRSEPVAEKPDCGFSPADSLRFSVFAGLRPCRAFALQVGARQPCGRLGVRSGAEGRRRGKRCASARRRRCGRCVQHRHATLGAKGLPHAIAAGRSRRRAGNRRRQRDPAGVRETQKRGSGSRRRLPAACVQRLAGVRSAGGRCDFCAAGRVGRRSARIARLYPAPVSSLHRYRGRSVQRR